MTDKNWIYMATLGPIGHVPKAPGTFGSIPGLIAGVILNFIAGSVGYLAVIAILVILTLVSIKAIAITEQSWHTHDDKRIVIDELVGQAIVVAFLPLTGLNVLLAFVGFRFFDILKPWPISFFDQKVPGAWGTLLDDVVAGIFALGTILIVQWFI